MERRRFLQAAVGTSALGTGTLVGCLEREEVDPVEIADEEAGENGDEGSLRVAADRHLIAGEDSTGRWLKDTFEEEFPDAELDWTVPDAGLDLYVEQTERDVPIDADVYVGVAVDQLAAIDADDEFDGHLFRTLERDRLDHSTRIQSDFEFDDPHERAIPYERGYLAFLYDSPSLERPRTFEHLLEPEFAGEILAQDPRTSSTGLSFLLWTIATFGEDGYLDYWAGLRENEIDLRDDWVESYEAYLDGERPMVVSYSTDRVAIGRDRDEDEDHEFTRHRIAFPNDQGFLTRRGAAIFERTPRVELAYQFVDFLLSSRIQTGLALRNARFPVVENIYVSLDEDFTTYALEPPETVDVDYETVRWSLEAGLEEWKQVFEPE